MKELKELLRKGERELARSLLKRQLSREGRPVEDTDPRLDRAAETLVGEAHAILRRRGGEVLRELKEASRELFPPKGDRR